MPGAVLVPLIDLRLQIIAYLEQLPIDRRQFINDGLEATPECRGLEFDSRQELFFDNRYSGVDLQGNPDFVKLAEAYGARGFRLRRSGDVRRVLSQALEYNDGPCVIDAVVEKEDNVFPMIPAGAPISDMLIEPPKEKLAKPEGST